MDLMCDPHNIIVTFRFSDPTFSSSSWLVLCFVPALSSGHTLRRVNAPTHPRSPLPPCGPALRERARIHHHLVFVAACERPHPHALERMPVPLDRSDQDDPAKVVYDGFILQDR